jgi:GAF domain-containing protein
MIAQMAARLNAQRTLEAALRTILNDSANFVGAKYGNVWLLDETGRLMLVAQRGFEQRFVLSFGRITLSSGLAASRAAASRTPVTIPNVDQDQAFTPFRHLAHGAGFVAVHATPLVAHSGACIGTTATYFGEERVPSALEQRMLETYGKIAADRIAALLGPEPVSLRAQRLFDEVLKQAEASDRNALLATRVPDSFLVMRARRPGQLSDPLFLAPQAIRLRHCS